MSNDKPLFDKQCVQPENTIEYGIVFCRTGRETKVAERLGRDHPGISALVPVKLRYRRFNGIAHEESVILFPGYVFFQAKRSFENGKLLKEQDVLKLLYVNIEQKDWRLTGSDRAIVKDFFRIGGVIGFSRAYYDEGDRIHILDGYLKEHEGQILKVNRRARTAAIRVVIAGEKIDLWLGFEEIKQDSLQ